jgi:hypothetical protein
MKRLALVVGSAQCVWQDTAALLAMATPDIVIAVNDMIHLWPGPIEHAASLHPDKLNGWLAARAAKGLTMPRMVWSHRRCAPVTNVASEWRGSSGLLGIKVAIYEQGFAGAVAVGMPMNHDPHVNEQNPWPSGHAFRDGWTLQRAKLKPRVRSMSGWTRELLGAPTPEWLAQIGAAPPDSVLIALCKDASCQTIEA